jgi:hypothetical protein
VPKPTVRDHANFVWAALVKGTAAFGARVAVLTLLVGGSVLTYGIAVKDWPLPWAIVAVLATLLVVFVLGACELFGQAYSVAIRFAPSWERLQTRADTLWALHNASKGTDDERFRAQFAASHSVAARQDFDDAAKAGHPLIGVTRDDIRHAGIENLPRIAAAFDDAAERFKASDAKEAGWPPDVSERSTARVEG